MPIGTPTTSATAGTSTASTTTASFTPTADSLLIALCAARGSSASIPTISDSQGGTWTPFAAGIDQGFITSRLFWRQIGSTPSAMTVTCEATSPTQTSIAVIEITGASTDFSNFGSASSGGPTIGITMGAYQPSSICVGFININAGANSTPPTGFTEMFDSLIATNLRSAISYDMSNPTTSLSWSANTADMIAWAVEIKEPAGVADELTAQDIAIAPTIELSDIGETNGLTALDLATAPFIGEPSIAQDHDVTAANMVTAPSIQTATLSQTHELVSQDIANQSFIAKAVIETGNPNYIKLRNAIRLMRRKSVRVIFRDEMWDDDNPVEL